MRIAWGFLFATAAFAQVSTEMVRVPDAADRGTEIPVTTIRGAQPGPTLALVAGNHGYEYPPILASYRLKQQLDPRTLRGTVIIVHIANLPSFLGRTVYFSPVDHKNLNRVYPGQADGTVSQRIAYAITKQVIEKADVVLDLHAGDGNENLRPYVYQAVTGDAAMDRRIADLATAAGFDVIVLDKDRPKDPARSLYCSTTAVTRGKPALTIESGSLGGRDEESIAAITRAVDNVMKHLGMRDGKPVLPKRQTRIEQAVVVTAPETGVMDPLVTRDQNVKKGDRLAVIRDFAGSEIADVRAPFDGVVLYIVATPPAVQGQPVAFVGAAKR
jgi:predicted deacylase